MSDALTNVRRHVNITCARSQHYTKKSVFWLIKRTGCNMTLHIFQLFVEPNVILNVLKDIFLIRQFTYVCVFTQVAAGSKKPGEKVTSEGIDVALNPEEIDDLGAAAMQAKYDQTLKEQQSQLEKEDLSDMVAEHAAKQKVRVRGLSVTASLVKSLKAV